MRQRPALQALEQAYGRSAVVASLRAEADLLRERFKKGDIVDDAAAAIERAVADRLHADQPRSLRTLINATGVVLHTNLGRAPLAEDAIAAVGRVAAAYSNLEYDIDAGGRGRRDLHAERLLRSLTGAEAACVVNNNAAATLLALAALAAGREVIVSRGELVEIGGGFRVPDVMQQSGAILREVGTTNRTRAADYAAAVSDKTALILRVHRSNFRIEGFTERPRIEELVSLGRRFGVAVVEDLGSGFLGIPTLDPLREEPSVAASIDAGVDAVMFSGDKLLGGPQAGIIAGTRVTLEPIRSHPLMRALRVDKMTYAALESTLEAYSLERWDEVPVVRMLRMTAEAIGERADTLAAALTEAGFRASVIDGASTIGGGSAPGAPLPTRLVELQHPTMSANELAARLRDLEPPIVARIARDRVVVDLRTVFPRQDLLLRNALLALR